MAATFTQVLQLHWEEALRPGRHFTELVEKWTPDYVFVTVVERASMSDLFAVYPPKGVAESRPAPTAL
jgi:alginate O-acetyltransferase complex protein AlgJ